MVFLAPLWLSLLVPWAALVAWLWRRTDEERTTTASFLWRDELFVPTRQRRIRRRPARWVIAALTALLLSIVALGHLSIAGRVTRVTILVDASAALAERSEGRTMRGRLFDGLRDEIVRSGIDADVSVRLVGLKAVASSIAEAVDAPFTAHETTAALRASIVDSLQDPVVTVAVTDKPIEGDQDRLIVRAPSTPRDNVGIVFASGLERPSPAVMVRVANDSERKEATLVVECGGFVSRRSVVLPPRGKTVDAFVPLPADSGGDVKISLVDLHDALAIDNHATLIRQRVRPRLNVEAGTPAVAARFAAAYARVGDDSASESIALRSDVPSAAERAVVLPELTPLGVTGDLRAIDHPLLRDIDLATPPIEHVAALPSGDWTIIASRGDQPLVAVREQPQRVVWIGTEVDPESLRSVVLLQNALDWIAEGDSGEWKGESPSRIGADWTPTNLADPKLEASPGVYLDAAGKRVAVNMPAIVGPRAASRGDLAAALRDGARASRRSLRPAFAVAAAGATLLAALLAVPRPVPRRTARPANVD